MKDRQPPFNVGLLRRALLGASRDDTLLQDVIDAADLALACGESETAQILYGVLTLQIGASSESLALLSDVQARTGWWTFPAEAPAPARSTFSIDMAIGELRALMALEPAPAPDLETGGAAWQSAMATTSQGGEAIDQGLVSQASEILRQAPEAIAQCRLHMLLQPIVPAMAAAFPVRLENHVGLAPSKLAGLLGFEALREFIVRNLALIGARSNPPLLDASAALERAALGPFLRNFRMLLRDERDCLGLVKAAASDGPALSHAGLEFWSLLVSAYLRPQELGGFAKDLGDHGLLGALHGIVDRIARIGKLQPYADTLSAIRDAGLDLGDLKLGAQAQSLIAHVRRTDSQQWIRLGLIHGALAEAIKAEAAFTQALFFEPENEQARVALALLRAGQPFVIERGFESSTATQAMRRALSRAHGAAITAPAG